MRSVASISVMLAILADVATLPATAADRYAAARKHLVDTQIVAAGIKNPRVIAAMRATPRHLFIPSPQRKHAYLDMALPIGGGQTISPPFVVAMMTAQLDPQPTDKVLEIGTGSGYQAAVLSGLVAEVYTIEIVASLGRKAARSFKRIGYRNIHARIGDGFKGWPAAAPFDKIIVTCSPEKVPQPLIEQLVEGGRMIVPVGERFQQTLCLLTKVDGRMQRETLEPTFFVPMTGQAEEARTLLPDTTHPQLVHGSFEETIASTDKPVGWYYIRQGRVEQDATAPLGERSLVFSNTTPGRHTHAMQAFGVDGRTVRHLNLGLWVRGDDLRRGQSDDQQAGVFLQFYGKNRAPVGSFELGPWQDTFEWTRKTAGIEVPAEARLAVIGIGLFGATGTVRFDGVEIEAQ